jgi:hypothetical protein
MWMAMLLFTQTYFPIRRSFAVKTKGTKSRCDDIVYHWSNINSEQEHQFIRFYSEDSFFKI